jgi:effector-binding domain-containing protein
MLTGNRRTAPRRSAIEVSMDILVQSVKPRILAAVRRTVAPGEVGRAWRSALDQVWHFLGNRAGLRTDGHNIFLYHHPARRDLPMDVDFGVEVTRWFEGSGEVSATETPGGDVVAATHIGPYERLGETHANLQEWVGRSRRTLAGKSWEVYGDWNEDPAKLETTVVYLLQ